MTEENVRFWYAMPFRFELDMLECQLREHADRVHKFVIMEATVDHGGVPKPLVLRDHWDHFAQWHHKIEYVVADWLPRFEENPSFWYREQNQRDIGLPYVRDSAADDDVVIVSDIDEFVPRDSFAKFLESGHERAGLMQKLRYAAVDWDGSPGVTAVMARAGVVKRGENTLDTLRQQRENFPVLEPGGYHFSWFGGPERYRSKLRATPHQESFDTGMILADGMAWERGLGWPDDRPEVTANVAEITDDYPEWVKSRECPWHWWRPGPDNLPADEQARQKEVLRRHGAKTEFVTCPGEHREVCLPDSGHGWHTDDLTPCPTAGI